MNRDERTAKYKLVLIKNLPQYLKEREAIISEIFPSEKQASSSNIQKMPLARLSFPQKQESAQSRELEPNETEEEFHICKLQQMFLHVISCLRYKEIIDCNQVKEK